MYKRQGYYLIGLSMKTSKSTRKNTKFEIAMEEYRNGESVDGKAVSYTHLTLPTSDLV